MYLVKRHQTYWALHDVPRPLHDKLGCESAWNKDPVFGVIGIETGPLRIWVTLASIVFGSRGLDVGRGDNRKDPTGVFQAG